MTKIKICGLSRLCDIDYVNTAMPDYIGFVFAPHSKRYVSPSQAAQLKAASDVPIIKAFSIKSKKDIQTAVLSSADYILLDNGAGGTGDAFNWSLISGISRPYFLAGGLTPNNVGQAVYKNHPFAVDASSGVETNGFKDFDKIKLFIETVRKTNI